MSLNHPSCGEEESVFARGFHDDIDTVIEPLRLGPLSERQQNADDGTDWCEQAWERWPDAEWIAGNGPIALVAYCRDVTVTLWEREEHAREQMAAIDDTGCGGRCSRDHEIVDMRVVPRERRRVW